MATETPSGRVEKIFSISLEADAFLQRVQRQSKADSESDALEALLNELMEAERLRVIDAAYTAYYDSLSGEDIENERSWGAFAEAQLAEAVKRDEMV